MSAADTYAPTITDQSLHALAVHRMLSTQQLWKMFTPNASIVGTRQRLGLLRRAGLVDSLPRRSSHAPKIWYATRHGLDRAMQDPDLVRRYQVDPDKTQLLVAHTLAVNDVGLAFVTHARTHGHDCDYLSWEHEVAHSLGSDSSGKRRNSLIVDAVLTYAIPSPDGSSEKLARRFVELDRATESLQRLHDKLRVYARYHTAEPRPQPGRPAPATTKPWWTLRYTSWPAVLVVVGANPRKSPDALRRRVSLLCGVVAADPGIHIPVLATTLDELATHGPGAPIWRRADTVAEQRCDFLGHHATLMSRTPTRADRA